MLVFCLFYVYWWRDTCHGVWMSSEDKLGPSALSLQLAQVVGCGTKQLSSLMYLPIPRLSFTSYFQWACILTTHQVRSSVYLSTVISGIEILYVRAFQIFRVAISQSFVSWCTYHTHILFLVCIMLLECSIQETLLIEHLEKPYVKKYCFCFWEVLNKLELTSFKFHSSLSLILCCNMSGDHNGLLCLLHSNLFLHLE